MKLISLNLWLGKVFKPLAEFIKDNSGEVDFFCFQEILDAQDNWEDPLGIRPNLLNELIKILKDYNFIFSPMIIKFRKSEPNGQSLQLGLVTFVHKKYPIICQGNYFIYKHPNDNDLKDDSSNMPIILQFVKIKTPKGLLSLYNYHGTPIPGSKLDTPQRLKNSKKLKEIIEKDENPLILTGDFNLMPWTKSVEILGEVAQDLIKDFKVTNTRSKLNLFDGKPGDQRFADFTFIRGDIKAKKFFSIENEVSDHLPLYLEFS